MKKQNLGLKIWYTLVRFWDGYASPMQICRWIKWTYQRYTRGFSDRQLWSLDYTIAKFIITRLKLFKEQKKHGIPTSIISELYPNYYNEQLTDDEDFRRTEECYKLWKIKLDKILRAFEYIVIDNSDLDYSDIDLEFKENEKVDIKSDPEKDKIRKQIIEYREKQIEEGLEIFAKYFRSLWD